MRYWILVLLSLIFIACGDKKADVVGGGESSVQAPTHPEEEAAEVIEEYEPESKFDPKELKIIYFAFDSYTLSKDMFAALNSNAELLKKDAKIQIILEGNTDAYGSDEYNLALGNKRALAVKEALIVRGIEKDRIQTVSFGETKPVCTTDNSPKCRQENRRVNFVLKGD